MGKRKRLKRRSTSTHQDQPELEVKALRDRQDLMTSILICAVLAVVTLAVYWQVTHFELLTFDDETYVFGNDFVKNGITLAGMHEAFVSNVGGNWHPVTWLSLLLDSNIYGPVTPTGTSMIHHLGPFTFEAEGYHLTNLLLHIMNTVLLFVFARWLTGSVWRGGFVAGLFALHPLHVESVAWVAERKDVLSTLFWLLTTLAYVWYAKPKRSANRAGVSRSDFLLRYPLLLILFALGLMAKPMLVTLPLTLLLLDFWPLKRFAFAATSGSVAEKLDRKTSVSPFIRWLPLVEKIPLFAMSLAACVVTYVVQSKGGAMTTAPGIGVPMRLATACLACATYLFKMIWPYHLAAMYPYPVRQNPLTGVVYTISPVIVVVAALVLVAITAAAIALRRKAPYVTFGWFWYLVTLIPVLGFVQVGYQSWADRYTYIPLIGIFIILACGIPDFLLKKPNAARAGGLAAAAAVVLGIFGYLTHAQAAWWHDSKKLYYRTIDVTAGNWFMRNALGRVLLKDDEKVLGAEGASSKAYSITLEARDHFEKAAEVDDGIADIHNNLGVAYRALSLFSQFREVPETRLKQAIDEFEEARRMDPQNGEPSLNLGMTLTQMGREDDAVAVYNALVQSPAADAPAAYWGRVNLSAILLKHGQKDECMQLLREAVEIDAKTGIDAGNQANQQLQQLDAPQR